MKGASFWIIITSFLFSFSASAMILPPNDLYKFDSKLRGSGLTQEQFNNIVDGVVALWAPMAELHKGHLSAEKLWDDPTVNAYADQQGGEWGVHFYGGLARRPEMTPDALALVVCHELGHHFGGYYFFDDSDDNRWAAAEGEADYFATHACARMALTAPFMSKYSNVSHLPKLAKKQCNATWKDKNAQKICYRMANGSLALARLLAAVGQEKQAPKFETPDPTIVGATATDHPAAQCRLDTYFQAALCDVQFDTHVIPGKDEGKGGVNTPDTEREAMKYSCFASSGHKVGNRPACWFKPQI